MIDRDLAQLYDVSTKSLNQTVTRNIKRFPPDFMFSTTKEEKSELVTNCDRFRALKHSSTEKPKKQIGFEVKEPKAKYSKRRKRR
jgi:hypothetical protein